MKVCIKEIITMGNRIQRSKDEFPPSCCILRQPTGKELVSRVLGNAISETRRQGNRCILTKSKHCLFAAKFRHFRDRSGRKAAAPIVPVAPFTVRRLKCTIKFMPKTFKLPSKSTLNCHNYKREMKRRLCVCTALFVVCLLRLKGASTPRSLCAQCTALPSLV